MKINFKAVCNHDVCTTEAFCPVSSLFPVLKKTGTLWLSAVRAGEGVEKAKCCWSKILNCFSHSTYNSFAYVT